MTKSSNLKQCNSKNASSSTSLATKSIKIRRKSYDNVNKSDKQLIKLNDKSENMEKCKNTRNSSGNNTQTDKITKCNVEIQTVNKVKTDNKITTENKNEKLINKKTNTNEKFKCNDIINSACSVLINKLIMEKCNPSKDINTDNTTKLLTPADTMVANNSAASVVTTSTSTESKKEIPNKGLQKLSNDIQVNDAIKTSTIKPITTSAIASSSSSSLKCNDVTSTPTNTVATNTILSTVEFSSKISSSTTSSTGTATTKTTKITVDSNLTPTISLKKSLLKHSIIKLTAKDKIIADTIVASKISGAVTITATNKKTNKVDEEKEQKLLQHQKENTVLDNIIKKPLTKQDKNEQQKIQEKQQTTIATQQQLQKQDIEDTRSKKKRCADRYDSSESSDSGVATLSCTDSSTASSDTSDPGSPYSPLSGSGDDLQNQTSKKKFPPPPAPPILLATKTIPTSSSSSSVTTPCSTDLSVLSTTPSTITKSINTTIMPPSQVVLAKTKLSESTLTPIVNGGKTTAQLSSASNNISAAVATPTNTLLSSQSTSLLQKALQINQQLQQQQQQQQQISTNQQTQQAQNLLSQPKLNLNLWPWHKSNVLNNNNSNNNNNTSNNTNNNNNNNKADGKSSISTSSLSSVSPSSITTSVTTNTSNGINTANQQTSQNNNTQNKNLTNSTMTTTLSAGSINVAVGTTTNNNNLSANNHKTTFSGKNKRIQNVKDNINNNSCSSTTTTANKKTRLSSNNNSINNNNNNNTNNTNIINANNNTSSLSNQNIPPLISTTSTLSNQIGLIVAASAAPNNLSSVQASNLKTTLANPSPISGISNKRLKLAASEESQTKITGYFKMKHKAKTLNVAQPMDIKSITTSTTTTTCITTINTTTVASNSSKTRTISSIPPLLRKIDRSKTKVAQVAPNLRKTTAAQTNLQLPLLAPKSPKKPIAIAPRIGDVNNKKSNNSLANQTSIQTAQIKTGNSVLLAAPATVTTNPANQSQPPPLQSIDPSKLTVSTATNQQTPQAQPAVLLTAIRIPQQQTAQLQLATATNTLNKNTATNMPSTQSSQKINANQNNQNTTTPTLTNVSTSNGSLYQIPIMPNLVQIPNIIAATNPNGATNLLVQPNGQLATARVTNANVAAAAAAAAAQLQLYGTVIKFQQQMAAAAAAANQSNQQQPNTIPNGLLTMDPTQLSNILMKSSLAQNVIPLSTITTATTTVASTQPSKTVTTTNVLSNLQAPTASNILTTQPPQLSRIAAPQLFMATSNGYILNAAALPAGAIFANAFAKPQNHMTQTLPALQPIQSSSIQTSGSNSNQQSSNNTATFLPSLSAILQAHQNHQQQQAASFILSAAAAAAAAQSADSTTNSNFANTCFSGVTQQQESNKNLPPPLLPTSPLFTAVSSATGNANVTAAVLAKTGQLTSGLNKATLISNSQVPPPPLVLSNTGIVKKISSITKSTQRGRKPLTAVSTATTTKPQRKKRITAANKATQQRNQQQQQQPKIHPQDKTEMIPLVPLVPISNKSTIKLPIDNKNNISSFKRSSPPPLEEIKKPIQIGSLPPPPPIVPISRDKFQLSLSSSLTPPIIRNKIELTEKNESFSELNFEGKIEKQLNEKLIENAERKTDSPSESIKSEPETKSESHDEIKSEEDETTGNTSTQVEDTSNENTLQLSKDSSDNDEQSIKLESVKDSLSESINKISETIDKENFEENVEFSDDKSEFEGKLIIKDDMSFGNEIDSDKDTSEKDEKIRSNEENEMKVIQPKEERKDDMRNEIEIKTKIEDNSKIEKENFEKEAPTDIFENSIKNNFERIFEGVFDEKKLIAFEEKLRQNYKEKLSEKYEENAMIIETDDMKHKFDSMSNQIDESMNEDVIKVESITQPLKIFSESSLSSNSSFSISSGVVANAIAAAAAEDTTTSSLHLSIDSQMYDSQLAAEVQVKLQDIAITKGGFFSNATTPCSLSISSSSSSTISSAALLSSTSISTQSNSFPATTPTTTNTATLSTPTTTSQIDFNISSSNFQPTHIDIEIANKTVEQCDTIGVETLQKCAISPILSQPKTIRFPAPGEMGYRFGSKGFKRRDGVCYWDGCNTKHETCSKLLDHMQIIHVNTQTGPFKCLWNGCKVHGRESCSRRWLERHVLSHGGSKMFKCIVDGCGLRFSSQLALQKHVNGHFNTMETTSSSTKRASDPPVPKQLKKTGKKLRYRLQPFSARMFDYIDSGIMEGLVHRLRIRTAINGAPGDNLVFSGHPVARRTKSNGDKEILVQWKPCGIIDNEWINETSISRSGPIEKHMKYTDFSCDEKIALNNLLRASNLHTNICTMTRRNKINGFSSFLDHETILNKLFTTQSQSDNRQQLITKKPSFNPNTEFDDEPSSMSSTSAITSNSGSSISTNIDAVISSSQTSDDADYSSSYNSCGTSICSGDIRNCIEKSIKYKERLNRKHSRKPSSIKSKTNFKPS